MYFINLESSWTLATETSCFHFLYPPRTPIIPLNHLTPFDRYRVLCSTPLFFSSLSFSLETIDLFSSSANSSSFVFRWLLSQSNEFLISGKEYFSCLAFPCGSFYSLQVSCWIFSSFLHDVPFSTRFFSIFISYFKFLIG